MLNDLMTSRKLDGMEFGATTRNNDLV